jgi:methylated-DNA-[protein]-cysteine S-methyltransferase
MATDLDTRATEIATPFGRVRLDWVDEQIVRLELGPYAPRAGRVCSRGHVPASARAQALCARLLEYFDGARVEFDYSLPAGLGTPFQRRVWSALRAIPYGSYVTYAELALQAGLPVGAARAAGQACARNPVPILLPCHRVVGAGGALTGFGAGMAWKIALLRLEGIGIDDDRLATIARR